VRKSIFEPFITGAQTFDEYQAKRQDNGNDRLVTVPDLFSYSRPVLAAIAGKRLIRGEKGATRYAAAAVATDMEGKAGLLLDSLVPTWRIGNSAHGVPLDIYMDALAMLGLGAAIMVAPRISLAGKAATASVLGAEGVKAGWGLISNKRYGDAVKRHETALLGFHRNEGDSELPEFSHRLELPPTIGGKSAMAEKMTSVVVAVATSEVDTFLARRALDGAALYFASVGCRRGEEARGNYRVQTNDLVDFHHEEARVLEELMAT